MANDNPYSHTNSRYERPLDPYRCGRARRWQKPCWQGPDNTGRCGGQSECIPARLEDRYLCRRPAHAGGPCQQGPLPDGSCCNQRPACVPQPSLRKRRRRYIQLAALVPLIALIAFANVSDQSLTSSHASINPGPLSRIHQEFAGEQGCGSCHSGHTGNLAGMAGALFADSTINESCQGCHDFAGRGELPHNRIFPDRADLESTQCLDCHSEHHGDQSVVPQLTDRQCGLACHQQPFSDFASAHPPFPDAFPSETPGSIKFDHQRHFKRHFPQSFRGADPAVIDQVKMCVNCHAVEQASREVTPKPYAQVCASCHEKDIAGATMVLAYRDEPTPVTALLLGINLDDTDEFDDARDEFLEAMADDGADYFAELLEQPGLASAEAQSLAEYFEDIPLYEIGEAWLNDESIELTSANGISADDYALYYRINGHGDAFARHWLSLAAKKLLSTNSDESRALLAALASDDEGATCNKCHAVGQVAETGAIPWNYRGVSDRPLSRYSHAPHINLLGLDNSCKNCHRINDDGEYSDYFEVLASGDTSELPDYESNFHPIEIDQCSSCHTAQGVDDRCILCHNYHQNMTLSSDALQRAIVAAPRVQAPSPELPTTNED